LALNSCICLSIPHCGSSSITEIAPAYKHSEIFKKISEFAGLKKHGRYVRMNAETRLLPPKKMIQEAGEVKKLWNLRPGAQAADGWKMRSK